MAPVLNLPGSTTFLAARLADGPTSTVVTPPLMLAIVLLLLAGLACDFIIFTRFANNHPFRVGVKPWGLRELVIAAAVVLAVMLLSATLYSIAAWIQGRHFDELVPVILPVELLSRLTMLLGFLIFFKARRISIQNALGLDQPNQSSAIAWGAIFTLGMLPPIGAVILVVNFVSHLLGIRPSEQPIVELFLHTDSPFLLGILVLFGVVVAPVFEEFLFRGFAYPALKQRFGWGAALLIVSAVFALNHLHGPSLLPLFVLAIGLGLAYELTGSLVAPIVMHALFNAIMILQVFHQRAQL